MPTGSTMPIWILIGNASLLATVSILWLFVHPLWLSSSHLKPLVCIFEDHYYVHVHVHVQYYTATVYMYYFMILGNTPRVKLGIQVYFLVSMK